MKRWLKLVAIGLSGIVALLLLAGAGLYVAGGSRIHRRYDVQPPALSIPIGDTAAIARGRHLAEAVTGCHGCHGDQLQGGVLIDEPMMATLYASNLTPGRGGIGPAYTDADLVRAIRHGVNSQGRGLMIMHADAYNRLGPEDLGALVAYVRSVPAVDSALPPMRTGPLGRILVALGMLDRDAMPLIPAEHIDHRAPLAPTPPPGVTAAYGEYLVSIAMCRMCHGANLGGGPPLDEGARPAPNIAGYAAPGVWTEAQFIGTIRNGVTPAGRTLDAEYMPWDVYARMTDEELLAIWRYLESLARR
ncbi:MAG TPA: c-type cytochrome [Gemmatimonadaceae bacterium]|nr:c-type cytochrome [Gemmatimonadaceae bacterium]